MFFTELSHGICLTILVAVIGLAAKLVATKLDLKGPREQADLLDELTGRLLVRKSLAMTFAGIYGWNLLVSAVLVFSGIISQGILPFAWTFLNFGLFSPDLNFFKNHIHLWLEGTATVLSAALGFWGGNHLNKIINGAGTPSLLAGLLIIVLYGAASAIETHEIGRLRKL